MSIPPNDNIVKYISTYREKSWSLYHRTLFTIVPETKILYAVENPGRRGSSMGGGGGARSGRIDLGQNIKEE